MADWAGLTPGVLDMMSQDMCGHVLCSCKARPVAIWTSHGAFECHWVRLLDLESYSVFGIIDLINRDITPTEIGTAELLELLLESPDFYEALDGLLGLIRD